MLHSTKSTSWGSAGSSPLAAPTHLCNRRRGGHRVGGLGWFPVHQVSWDGFVMRQSSYMHVCSCPICIRTLTVMELLETSAFPSCSPMFTAPHFAPLWVQGDAPVSWYRRDLAGGCGWTSGAWQSNHPGERSMPPGIPSTYRLMCCVTICPCRTFATPESPAHITAACRWTMGISRRASGCVCLPAHQTAGSCSCPPEWPTCRLIGSSWTAPCPSRVSCWGRHSMEAAF